MNEQSKKVLMVIRYIIGTIIIIAVIANSKDINSYYILSLLLLGLSLYPIFYKLLFKNEDDSKIFQIFIPIALVIISFFQSGIVYTVNEDKTEQKIIKSVEPSNEEIKEKIKKSFSTNLSLSNFIENSENKTFNLEIDQKTTNLYDCAKYSREAILSMPYSNKIKKVTITCYDTEKTLNYIEYNNVENINENNIDKNVTYFDINKNEINTNIKMLEKEQEEIDKTNYKNECKQYNYKTIARTPEEYIGKKAYWFGKVVQIVDKTSSSYTMRVSVSCEKYKYIDEYDCPDTIYVTYYGDVRLLEDDMIKMWGTLSGEITYESILGANITIPSFIAKYIEIQ